VVAWAMEIFLALWLPFSMSGGIGFIPDRSQIRGRQADDEQYFDLCSGCR